MLTKKVQTFLDDSIKFVPNHIPGKIIFRTTNPSAHSPLSRYPQKETLHIAGKALRRKNLGHRKKS